MDLPKVTSTEEWLEARKELLAKEKEETRRRDALRAERRALPMVEVEKNYVFEGRQQLIVQHFMFDPKWEDGSPSCTYAAEDLGDLSHLHGLNTSFAVVSRAPIQKIEDYKQRKGWTFPWYSSFGSDFNYDFQATVDEDVAPVYVNYRTAEKREAAEIPSNMKGEIPGYSVFLRDGETVYGTPPTRAASSCSSPPPSSST